MNLTIFHFGTCTFQSLNIFLSDVVQGNPCIYPVFCTWDQVCYGNVSCSSTDLENVDHNSLVVVCVCGQPGGGKTGHTCDLNCRFSRLASLDNFLPKQIGWHIAYLGYA